MNGTPTHIYINVKMFVYVYSINFYVINCGACKTVKKFYSYIRKADGVFFNLTTLSLFYSNAYYADEAVLMTNIIY